MSRKAFIAVGLAIVTTACASGRRESAVDNVGARPSATAAPEPTPHPTGNGQAKPIPTVQPARHTPDRNAPRELRYTQSTHAAKRGDTIKVSGTGCFTDRGVVADYVELVPQANATGDVWSAPGTWIAVISDGTWAGTLTVPHDSPTGRIKIVVACIKDSEPFGANTEDYLDVS